MIIDSLDECDGKTHEVGEFLAFLQDLTKQNAVQAHNVKICFASRSDLPYDKLLKTVPTIV
jgi:hypothetical protein